MELERGRLLEIVVSVGVVGVFVGVILLVGLQYNTGEMAPSGGLALVGAMAAFVLVMAVVGVLLATHLNQE